MSETVKYVKILKDRTPAEIDVALAELVKWRVDCYAEGASVFVEPDQYEMAIELLNT